jgi:hypothetical protein
LRETDESCEGSLHVLRRGEEERDERALPDRGVVDDCERLDDVLRDR